MTKPIRVQLSRRKGWRLPPNTVIVSRPGPWGNPFSVLPDKEPGSRIGPRYFAVPTVKDAVECFRMMIEQKPDMIYSAKAELSGKNLACWCKPGDPCHADVLLEIANT